MKKEMSEKLISIRRHIHSNPELGGEEFATTAFVEKILKSAGFATKRITKTGVVGLIYGTKKGSSAKTRTIMLRADIDALPITEKTGKCYASKKSGVMHACGHDGNTAIVLGAAMELANRRDEFHGCVKLIFQPKEETGDGALSLIRAGVLNNPGVNAVIGVHVSPWLKPGLIGLKEGHMMAAVDKFEIEVIGDGGHGAYPHKTKDPIVLSAESGERLQLVRAGVAGIPVGSQADGLRRGAAFLFAPVEPELSTEREAGIRAVRGALAKEIAKPVAPARAYVLDCRRATRLDRQKASTTFVILKRIPSAGWARH